MEAKTASKYALAAVIVAIAIIAGSLYTIPLLTQPAATTTGGQTAQGNFLVMLTDPPNVPAGTTQLNVSYSGVVLHVTYSDGSTGTVPVTASGTADLMSLVNATRTIGSTTLPTGTTVDSVQLTITAAQAKINGTVTPVTILSSQLSAGVEDGKVGSGLSGVLFDFTPTLMQIRSTDATGTDVNYYVLVPNAAAVIRSNVDEA